MRNLEDAHRFLVNRPGTATFTEHLRTAALSVGTYCLSAGAIDDQRPHREDEVYLVVSGSGALRTPSETIRVGAGSVLYVPAGEPHRFVDITDDLTIVVVFAPPYSGPPPD